MQTWWFIFVVSDSASTADAAADAAELAKLIVLYVVARPSRISATDTHHHSRRELKSIRLAAHRPGNDTRTRKATNIEHIHMIDILPSAPGSSKVKAGTFVSSLLGKNGS